jgi:hypothetical protein
MRIYLAGRPQGWNIIKDGKVKSLQSPEMGIYREAIIADMGGVFRLHSFHWLEDLQIYLKFRKTRKKLIP